MLCTAQTVVNTGTGGSVNQSDSVGRTLLMAGSIVLFAVAVIVEIVAPRMRPRLSRADVHSAAERTANALRHTPVSGLGVTSSHVEGALAQSNRRRAAQLKVSRVGTDSYEISRDDGESPVCLTITSEPDLF